MQETTQTTQTVMEVAGVPLDQVYTNSVLAMVWAVGIWLAILTILLPWFVFRMSRDVRRMRSMLEWWMKSGRK